MSNYGKWYIYPEGPCLTQFFGIEIKPVYTKFAVFERKDFVLTSFPQLGPMYAQVPHLQKYT